MILEPGRGEGSERRLGRLKEAQKVRGRTAALGSAARKFVPGKMSE